MNMPSKGSTLTVEGYGTGIYAGMRNPPDREGIVMLKFEGLWDGHDLDAGYGSGIIAIPLDEFEEQRAYPEQVARGEPLVESTEKRDEILAERFDQ